MMSFERIEGKNTGDHHCSIKYVSLGAGELNNKEEDKSKQIQYSSNIKSNLTHRT